MKKIVTTLAFLLLFPFSIWASGTTTEEISTEENKETQNIVNLEEESVVISDGDTKTVTSKYFDLVLIRKAQLPFGKKVPYEIEITSHIDSPKTQILWEVPTTMTINAKHNEFISIGKDETKKFKATLTPNRDGTYVVGVNVISWQFDTNYTNSIKDTLEFDKNLVLQPVSDAYKVGNILKIFLLIVMSLVALYAGYFFTKKGMKYIKKWLTPPM
jgi:hypothetical protein